jgi:hypothetical protein
MPRICNFRNFCNIEVNWQINEVLSLHGGYRALYMKYNSGESEWKGIQHGPWFGLGFSS